MVVVLSTAEGRKFVTGNENAHLLTDVLLESTSHVRSDGYFSSVEVSNAKHGPTNNVVA